MAAQDTDAKLMAQIIGQFIDDRNERIINRTFKRGIVSAVDGTRADVKVDGSDVATKNVLCLASYAPFIGDKVLLLSIGDTGANLVVLGVLENRTAAQQTDANGWRLERRDGKRVWSKRGSTGYTVGASGWGSGTTTPLPVGMGTIGDRIVTGVAGTPDAAVTVQILARTTDNVVIFPISNQYGETVTNTIHWSIEIRDK